MAMLADCVFGEPADTFLKVSVRAGQELVPQDCCFRYIKTLRRSNISLPCAEECDVLDMFYA